MGALLRPTSGTVRIAGTATSSLSDPALSALRAHQLGFVFQDYVLIAGATALENVADGLLYCGIAPAHASPARGRRSTASDWRRERPTPRPSCPGGAPARRDRARARRQPELVLADEPTGNLDSHSKWTRSSKTRCGAQRRRRHDRRSSPTTSEVADATLAHDRDPRRDRDRRPDDVDHRAAGGKP